MNYLKRLVFLSSFLFISLFLCGFSLNQEKINTVEKKVTKLVLIRDTSTKKITLGRLYCNGAFVAYTLERPWVDNKQNISCVPKGDYTCRVRFSSESPKFKYDHLIVENVKNRSYILFHRGYTVKNTKGCILTGMKRDKNSIWKSKEAHEKLMKVIKEGSQAIEFSIV